MVKNILIPDTVPKTVHPLFKQRLCYSISKSGTILRSILEITLAKHKLNAPQSGILHILAGLGDYNQLQLGQEMSIDKASMVKFIDGLEEQGLVQRKTDPNDRRAKLLTLTAKGRTLQKKILEQHKKIEASILKDFNKQEVEALRELMPRVLEAILNHVND